jgi:chaperone required for assembly of F1-ATPase
MLQDVANTYIQSEKAHGEERDLFHYNCAQTLLYSCDDYYKLGLDEQAKKWWSLLEAGSTRNGLAAYSLADSWPLVSS